MEPPRNISRKAVDAVCYKYWSVVEMKEESHRLVAKAAIVYVALTHFAWEEIQGIPNYGVCGAPANFAGGLAPS